MIRSHDGIHVLLSCRATEPFFLRVYFSVVVQSCSGTYSLEEQRKSADLLYYSIVVGKGHLLNVVQNHRLGKLEIFAKRYLRCVFDVLRNERKPYILA